MQTAPHVPAPEISQQLFVSVGATYLGKIPLKQDWGVIATLHPLSLLTGQFIRAHVATRCDPAGPSKLRLQRGADVQAETFGSVHTPAERFQSHRASPCLHFSGLTDLCDAHSALSNMNPRLSSFLHLDVTHWNYCISAITEGSSERIWRVMPWLSVRCRFYVSSLFRTFDF